MSKGELITAPGLRLMYGISAFYNQRREALDLTGETDISDNYLLVKLYSKLDFPHQEGRCQNI